LKDEKLKTVIAKLKKGNIESFECKSYKKLKEFIIKKEYYYSQ